jgi:hypothetical protein
VEREITVPVPLCRADGSLSDAAIGWARAPLVRPNVAGHFPRKKRWDYHCVLDGRMAFSVVQADVDYLGLAAIVLIDLASGRTFQKGIVTPLGRDIDPPPGLSGAPFRVEKRGFFLDVREEEAGTRITAAASRLFGGKLEADVLVERPPGDEGLHLAVPLRPDGFQLNVKEVARPARGRVRAWGKEHRFGDDAFGALDVGRGVWPYRTSWNWAVAAGRVGARRIGLNLGARWTDGAGVTENALFVDGRLEKIHGETRFDYDLGHPGNPWNLRTEDGRIDVTLTPQHVVRQGISLGILRTSLRLAFGRVEGQVRTEAGETLTLRGFSGWAEDHRARW